MASMLNDFAMARVRSAGAMLMMAAL